MIYGPWFEFKLYPLAFAPGWDLESFGDTDGEWLRLSRNWYVLALDLRMFRESYL